MQTADAPIDESLVAQLVDEFYAKVWEDPLIGPVFERYVNDWDQHLPQMVAFWRKTVLYTGTYNGRPMEAHMRIPGLGEAHFERWLKLWSATVHEVVPAHAQQDFILAAQRIATSIVAVLNRTDAPS